MLRFNSIQFNSSHSFGAAKEAVYVHQGKKSNASVNNLIFVSLPHVHYPNFFQENKTISTTSRRHVHNHFSKAERQT
jgi:hypothetical protein